MLNDTSGRNSLPNAALSSFGSSEKGHRFSALQHGSSSSHLMFTTGRTILLMVYDLLDTLGLKESLSVFEAEANCKVSYFLVLR